MPDVLGTLKAPRLAGAPSSPVAGQLYFDTSTSTLYWWSGSAWVAASGGAGTSPTGVQSGSLSVGLNDLASPTAAVTTFTITGSTAASVRSVGAPPAAGNRYVLRNGSTAQVSLINAGAGTGAALGLRDGITIQLYPGEAAEFVYDGTVWREVTRDVAGGDAVIASQKLSGNAAVLSLPAGSFPAADGAVEINAVMFQASNCSTSERISWGWRPLPAVGTILYGITCNPGTGSPGQGQAFSGAAATISSFLCHTSARQNTLMAFFHATLYSLAEGRAHFMTFEWASLSDFSGTAANDLGHGTGRAHIVPDNVRAQAAVTGFEIYGTGTGFGTDSAIWAKPAGQRRVGVT